VLHELLYRRRRRLRCSSSAAADAPLGPNITASKATERCNTRVEKLTPISGLGPLQDVMTAQYTAAMWLAGSDPSILDLAAVELDQLFLAISLGSSVRLYIRPTRVTKWTNKRGFLTADTVCDWNDRSGVECNDVCLIDVIIWVRPSNYFLVHGQSRQLTH
jgi:hypothetical protein